MAEETKDKSTEKLSEEIKSLNAVINELSEKNLRGFNKIIEASNEIEANKENASDLARDVIGRMKSIADDNRKNSAGDRKKSIKEIESLQRSITLEKDDSTKKLIQGQLKALKQTTSENSSFLQRSNDFFAENLSAIGGVLVGVLADSPILAVGTDFLIRKAQGVFEKDKSARNDERERAESIRDKLIGDKVELASSTIEESSQDQNPPINEGGDVELANGADNAIPNQEDIREGNEGRNSLLGIISERLESILGVVQPLVEDSEEKSREEKVFNDNLLSALEGKGDSKVEKVDGKDVGSSVFGALIASKFIAPLIGLLGSLGVLIKGFALGLGKVFLKVLTKVFLPIAIIGGLFSGVMEAIDVFKKTGSMKEAFIGFLGGMLDFITFGLIGTDELKTFGKFISSKLSFVMETIAGLLDYIINPIKKLNKVIKDSFGFDVGEAAGDIIKSISQGLGRLLLFMIDKIPFASKIIPESLIASIEQMAGEKLGEAQLFDPLEKDGGSVLRDTRASNEKTKEEILAAEQSQSANIAAIDNSVVNNSQNNSIITRPTARNDFSPLTN